jgi:hypothetical protein
MLPVVVVAPAVLVPTYRPLEGQAPILNTATLVVRAAWGPVDRSIYTAVVAQDMPIITVLALRVKAASVAMEAIIT